MKPLLALAVWRSDVSHFQIRPSRCLSLPCCCRDPGGHMFLGVWPYDGGEVPDPQGAFE